MCSPAPRSTTTISNCTARAFRSWRRPGPSPSPRPRRASTSPSTILTTAAVPSSSRPAAATGGALDLDMNGVRFGSISVTQTGCCPADVTIENSFAGTVTVKEGWARRRQYLSEQRHVHRERHARAVQRCPGDRGRLQRRRRHHLGDEQLGQDPDHQSDRRRREQLGRRGQRPPHAGYQYSGLGDQPGRRRGRLRQRERRGGRLRHHQHQARAGTLHQHRDHPGQWRGRHRLGEQLARPWRYTRHPGRW